MSKIFFPNETILKTNLFTVAQDWEVPICGFFIVSPNRKIKSIDEFTTEEAHEFADVMIKVRKAMREVLKIEEIYLFQNEDTNHGFHLWMEKFGRKIESVRPIMKYAVENMNDEKNLDEVGECVGKMIEYFNNPSKLVDF